MRRLNHLDMEVIGFEGCTDEILMQFVFLTSLIVHPNVGGILAIGLGCEYTQADRLAKTAQKHGRLAKIFLYSRVVVQRIVLKRNQAGKCYVGKET